jgi:hypothetical protein
LYLNFFPKITKYFKQKFNGVNLIMQPALHLTTKVLPGNKIEIDIPEGEIGDTVDVFVVLPAKPKEKSGCDPAPTKGTRASVRLDRERAPSKRSVLEIIEESRSRNTLRSAEDIDRQLREERDSWDS